MTLCDAGPLIALLNRSDAHHAIVSIAIKEIRLPLVTSWAAIAEAMHMLNLAGGWSAQSRLLAMMERRVITVFAIEHRHLSRIREFMAKYADHPMDLADATLLVAAEELKLRRIFTLDEDFRVYRMKGRRQLQVIP